MTELRDHGHLGTAAVRAGMSPNTARKYRDSGKLPSETSVPRSWRTRENPFEDDWCGVVEQLKECPELEAKTIFEELCEAHPERYEPGQLRTLQRHVSGWRAAEGPPREVFFSQQHRPGEAMQTDGTCCNKLEITINGEEFPHLLCHTVLPYSNWEWATVCRSESMAALKRGMQAFLWQLGRSPKFSQTDNCSAATHDIKGRGRGFNVEYEAFVKHYSMEPRTIGIGKSNQNGDVESSHNALKRYLKQRLLVRGSRDFESVEEYEKWVWKCVRRRNRHRSTKLEEELAEMGSLPTRRFPEYTVYSCRVKKWSTIRVRGNAYSVPSRLIDHEVRVHLFDDRVEVYYSGKLQVTMERLLGTGGDSINYRHVIWSLVRKPGAFERYGYREHMYPTVAFRKTYDALQESLSGRKATLEYLRVLHLAASTTETEVESVLVALLEKNVLPTFDTVKKTVPSEPPGIPDLAAPEVNLEAYDQLLEEVAS